MRTIAALVIPILLVGCAGKVEYIKSSFSRPIAMPTAGSNSKVIDKPRDAIWNASVPELGKQFFVINNLDKSSGLINLSYSGDPERYIDCGRVTSYVKDDRGARRYDFAAAKAQQNWELFDPDVRLLMFIDRRMALEGRVNLVFEEIGPAQTRITANTRYVLQRQQTVRDSAGSYPQTFNATASFNYGATGSFPPNRDGLAVDCVATGALEREILSTVK